MQASLVAVAPGVSVSAAYNCNEWQVGTLQVARVVELVDTPDLKSCGLLPVRVRFPPRVRKKHGWSFLTSTEMGFRSPDIYL